MKFKKLISSLISLSIISAATVIPARAQKVVDEVIYSQDFNTLKRSVYNDNLTKDMVYNSIGSEGEDLFWWYRGSMIHEVDSTHGGYDGTRALYLNARNGGRYYNDDNSVSVSNVAQGTANNKIEIPFVSSSTAGAINTGYYVITFDYYPSVGKETFGFTGRTAFADGWPGDLDYIVSNTGGSLSTMERAWHTVEIAIDLDQQIAYYKVTKKSDGAVVRDDHCPYTRGLGIFEIQTDHQAVSNSDFSKAENSAIVDNIVIKKRESIPDPKIQIVNSNNGAEKDYANLSNKIKEITVDFGTGVKPSTLTASTVFIKEDVENGKTIECDRNYNENIYTLLPRENLKEEESYVFVISGVEYSDGEAVKEITLNLSTKYNDVIKQELSFENDFENVTNSNLSSWKNSYNLYKNGWFRIYSTVPNTNTCLYEDGGNHAMYLAVKNDNKNKSAMQLVVANNLGTESLNSGRYKLSYDFYPAQGKNTLTLVKSADISEGMAEFDGGASLMKDKTFTDIEWYDAEVEIDFEKEKASIAISKKTDGTEVFSNEITYSDDLNVFNFYMSGTNVCTKEKSAIFDNFSFNKVLCVPEMMISVIDADGEKQTDLSQVFPMICGIEVDFGMDVVESSVNNNSIYLLDNDGRKVEVEGVLDGSVYTITPKYELEDLSEYTLVLSSDAKYYVSESEDKAIRRQKFTLNTGDSRPDPIVSVIGGDDKEVFVTTNLLCAVKEIRVDFVKEINENTLSENSVLLVEKQGENPVSCSRVFAGGIYTLVPDELLEGVEYELIFSSDVKYANGKSLREFKQGISIFGGSVNYYQDFEDAEKFATWTDTNIFDLYKESPVVYYGGSNLVEGIGFDGTTAFVLSNQGTHKNRSMEIPFGKSMKTSGVYEVVCDYYPSEGLDCINLRGNHTFAVGYGAEDGIALYSASSVDREWMTLTVTVDLDSQTASYDIVSKESGESVASGSKSYLNPLGLIEFYMDRLEDIQGKSWTNEESMILDNIKITRLPYQTAPTIRDTNLEFCVDDVVQTDMQNVSPLTNNIRIIPTQEILMSSIAKDNIYLSDENGNKIYCTMTYKDGVISICPDDVLKSATSYTLNVEYLENPDGLAMKEAFRIGFKTSKDTLKAEVGTLDEATWTIKNIKKNGEISVNYNILNQTDKTETLHFVVAYYNEDYSKLLKIEQQKVEIEANTAETERNIVFSTIPDFSRVQINVLNSLSEMNVISAVKEPQ